MATDEQLLADYLNGNAEAFAELVRRYQNELFSFLYRFVGETGVAEDLFQETFIQVHRNARSFDGTRKFRPWLFTIGANKARDYLRSSGRRAVQSLDNNTGYEEAGTFLDLMESDTAPPPDYISNQEDIQAVRAILGEMPEIYREVLLLNYFHQFPYKQMAEMLDVPLGTIKSRLHAAIASFAKAWKQRQKSRF